EKMPVSQVVYIENPLPNHNLRIKSVHLKARNLREQQKAVINLIIRPVDKQQQAIGLNSLAATRVELGTAKGIKDFDVSKKDLYMPPGGIVVGLKIVTGDVEMNTKPQKNTAWAYGLKIDGETAKLHTANYNFKFGITVVDEGQKPQIRH